jgi:RNA recognition motif-containing protein
MTNIKTTARLLCKQKEIRMNIYVGNLSYEVTEEDLHKAFEGFGQIDSVKIIKDNYSGRSKGFGFVEMPDNAEAQSAIDDLNDKDLKGRTLKINKARPRTEDRGGRGGFGGGGRGGRQGGGRRY